MPAGAAVGAPLDPAVGRVGGPIVHTGDLEGAAVDPGAMAVAIGEENRSVGDDGIEILPQRGATGESPHRPSSAQDPLFVRLGGGISGDRLEGFGAGLNPQHGEPEQFEPRGDRVAVGVLKTRDQQTAAKVDNVGGGPDVLADLPVAADGDDPTPLDRHGAAPATSGVGGEHRSVDEGEAGRHGPAVCQGVAEWWRGRSRR